MNDLLHSSLLKKFVEKSRKKNASKGHPRAHTLAELKEHFPGNFFTIHDKRRNPLVQIHAPGSKHRHPCTLSAGGVPK